MTARSELDDLRAFKAAVKKSAVYACTINGEERVSCGLCHVSWPHGQGTHLPDCPLFFPNERQLADILGIEP